MRERAKNGTERERGSEREMKREKMGERGSERKREEGVYLECRYR